MLVAGIFWGPWFALTRSLSEFNAEEFIKITQVLSANLGKLMRVLLPTTILMMILSAGIYPQKGSTGFYLIIAAITLLIISLIITLTTELPIVKRVEKWTLTTLPSDWTDIRDRWIWFHVVRTSTSLLGFACLIISVLFLR